MKHILRNIYYFLPVQLLLLHFRKYHLLLFSWLILAFIISGDIAAHFGGMSLFSAPEYLGKLSFMSMYLQGSAVCVFIMTWHITTFLIHSKRIPYMGATRHSFLVYCINNSIIPILFLIYYSMHSIRFQMDNEGVAIGSIVRYQFGFYLGLASIFVISFMYFFRVSRDFFKSILSNLAKPSKIRSLIPYDTLDYEIDIIQAQSFINNRLQIALSEDLETYHPRVLNAVLKRHHRNVIFATFFAYVILLVLGIYMEQPFLRIPAAAGFFLFFSIIMGLVGAFKYFLKSWEALGWIIIGLVLSVMVQYRLLDMHSRALGIDYNSSSKPAYTYEHIREVFSPKQYQQDLKAEEQRLDRWRAQFTDTPTMVVISTSGGGSRSTYWTLRTLQYLDSLTHGQLFKSSVLISGASGGMIGACYWRSIHEAHQSGKVGSVYSPEYQENAGKDLLNAIVFSLVSVDLISPINKVSFDGLSYKKDRGYAMEEQLIRNTDGLMNKPFTYFKEAEYKGIIPQLMVNSTIINDGRKLIMSTQPVGYMTQPEYSLNQAQPPIDAIDYGTFFAGQKPLQLRLATAMRMNAIFPFVLPVVELPSEPKMNVMDAGLRDNFGTETTDRYIHAMRHWINRNTKRVIYLQIRDTREHDVCDIHSDYSLSGMIFNPLFVIQNRWEAFQSYKNGLIKDYTPQTLPGKIQYVTMSYVPGPGKPSAALNFHLTRREKADLAASIHHPCNKNSIATLLQLLQ